MENRSSFTVKGLYVILAQPTIVEICFSLIYGSHQLETGK